MTTLTTGSEEVSEARDRVWADLPTRVQQCAAPGEPAARREQLHIGFIGGAAQEKEEEEEEAEGEDPEKEPERGS